MADIDIVVTWVNGADPAWVQERNKYSKTECDNADVRYRDWDSLRYFFRSVEKNMPWVRKIHLVTWGHVPEWLNTSNPKLHIVKHTDFIPEKYLPTFNSNAIELNMHRIPGLAEQFICFNDDMLALHETVPSDFFKDGKVCDLACVSPQPIYREDIISIELNNMKIINDHFTVADVKNNKNWRKISKYGQYAVRTMIFTKFQSILGIFQPHVPYSFFKASFEKMWELEGTELDNTSSNKFRSRDDVNLWLVRSYQLLSGMFLPRSHRFGKLISASDINGIKAALADKRVKLACINDDASVTDFEKTKNEVNTLLQSHFSAKSSFEK